MFEFIDKVVYINLAERTDRRERMELVTERFANHKVERFEAIVDDIGIIGCCKSHIAVLRKALHDNVRNVLILEDDVEWNKFDDGYAKLEGLVKNPYDVILLGGNYNKYDVDTSKLYEAQCAHAYLVNADYIPVLLSQFEDALSGMLRTHDLHAYAHDIYWKKLQPIDNWYLIIPSLLYQRPNYSNLEKRDVDYTSCMNL